MKLLSCTRAIEIFVIAKGPEGQLKQSVFSRENGRLLRYRSTVKNDAGTVPTAEFKTGAGRSQKALPRNDWFLLVLSLFILFAGSATGYGEPILRIVQPYENATLAPLKQSFVFGSVVPATASLTINGATVTPHTNGGFLTMIPFNEGKFQIEAVANDGVSVTTVTRVVNVTPSTVSFPEKHGKIEPRSPRTRVVLREGDTLEASFQAAPGGKARFRFEGGGGYLPMEEVPGGIKGIYKGVYTFKPQDKFENSDIIFHLRRMDGKKIAAKAGAELTLQRREIARFIETKEDVTFLTGPDFDYGYNLFGVSGTRLEVTGEWGDFYRVALGETNHSWIKKSATLELPAGTIPAKSISRNIRIDATEEGTILLIPLQNRHPHRIEQFSNPNGYRLTLYGVVADTDRIRFLSNKSVVKEVTWFQSEPTTCVFNIQTSQDQSWGTDVRYKGSTLLFEIRHRPPHQPTLSAPLRGLCVAVDAGHSKASYGTIGPLGNTEAAVCLMVANVVKQEIEKKGGVVVMIQDGTKELSLQDRVNLAWSKRAHFFISIHADACAEGQDPREWEGYSVHYYHPQSRAFAESVHKIYGEKTKIRDQGLWRSNLAVCRAPQMPSILLEQGFLVLPEFEELILTARQQRLVADIVISGILDVMKNNPR
jgi:N-acetylmuramoyl-L-alanine amidase